MKELFFLLFVLVITVLSTFLISARNVLAKANLSINATDITFSKENPLEGDKVRVFARVFNSNDVDISGFVLFLNNGKEMADPQPISVKVNTYDDVFIDWSAVPGTYNIQAKIVSTVPQDENSADDFAGKENYFVDIDTDKDGVGNAKDLDDDNDGISDIEEVQKGTNPLKEDIAADLFKEEEEINASAGNEQEEERNQNGIFSSIAPKIVTTGKTVIQNINEFADNQKENLEKKKEEVKKDLAENIEMPKGKVTIEKPLKYALLASLSAVSFVLGHKILFYLVLAFAFYQIIKFFVRRVKRS